MQLVPSLPETELPRRAFLEEDAKSQPISGDVYA